MLKTMFAIIFGVAALSAHSARAQVQVDMSKVTCAEYLALPDGSSADFSAWMSGWFNQKNGSATINLAGYSQNVANVKKWCESSPNETVMAGLQRASPVAQAAPPAAGGALVIDTTRFTCKDIISAVADPDSKVLITSWMGGYFSSTKNITTVDLRYVKRNSAVVFGYCAKHKNENLMRVVQKNWK